MLGVEAATVLLAARSPPAPQGAGPLLLVLDDLLLLPGLGGRQPFLDHAGLLDGLLHVLVGERHVVVNSPLVSVMWSSIPRLSVSMALRRTAKNGQHGGAD
mgnify:CR=1 FL=1